MRTDEFGDMRFVAGCSLALVAASIVTVAPVRIDAAPTASCGGVVFLDLDADGNRREALGRDGLPDDLEAGLPGVDVTITERTGRTETTTTAGDGTWTTDATGYPIRMEITPPDGLHETVAGPTSATALQFIARPDDCGGPVGSVGLVDPQRYCAADAPLVAICHQRSDVDDFLPSHPTVERVSASTKDDRSTDAVVEGDWLTEPTEQLASVGSIGTVYGLATAPDGRIFAAAFVKRHTELRSDLNPDGNPTAIFELGVDERPRLLTILDETADDPHRPDGRSPATDDTDVLDDVFRSGIGDPLGGQHSGAGGGFRGLPGGAIDLDRYLGYRVCNGATGDAAQRGYVPNLGCQRRDECQRRRKRRHVGPWPPARIDTEQCRAHHVR